ncbi:succinyl-CoA ligase [ADP-forming] subunit alpha [mine drainage metagenome]|uniref:Succinyl-CoA ligase [ADP-forming] subunit alpha n=1 Tax=mine drainage metagenome TaxID=410659 RepID=A0A1J5R8K7_9ZZZZ
MLPEKPLIPEGTIPVGGRRKVLPSWRARAVRPYRCTVWYTIEIVVNGELMLTTVVKPNTYQDSVSLMLLSQKLTGLSGVVKVSVMMGTPANKDILRATGFSSAELDSAAAGDLVLGMDLDEGTEVADIVAAAEDALKHQARAGASSGLRTARSLDKSLAIQPDANLALVSIPGEYVAGEVAALLARDLNVMIFSDNVSIDDELALKQVAHERGLLLMGPDCGTAAIAGVPLAFANTVRRGNIGIAGASGTGTQEVMSQIDQLGGGVSSAIGLGGRDLGDTIGGLTCIQALDALDADAATSTIVIISKPPAPSVRAHIEQYAQRLTKNVVVVFLGQKPTTERVGNISYAYTLADAAARAVELAGRGRPAFTASQRWIRGLYTGGTLASEAAMLILDELGLPGGDPSHANGYMLRSGGHEILDLGDDVYTRGRPHPMIDPSTRVERLPALFDDEGTAVILLDVVIGFGASDDPAGAIVPAIRDGIARAAEAGRDVVVVASVCGTHADIQGFDEQQRKLREAGVTVLPNNAAAVRHATSLVAHAPEPSTASGAPRTMLAPPPRIAQLLTDGPSVVNIGLRSFAETLSAAGVSTVQYDWSPAAGGDPRLVALLQALDNA